jgi:hypothetical protein
MLWLDCPEVSCLVFHTAGLELTSIKDPSGIYGALANLKMIVDAGQLSPSDISNLPAAVQRVIANLAVA